MIESLIFGARLTIYFSHRPPPDPAKISHKNGRRMQLHRFHVSQPVPYLATGSATAHYGLFLIRDAFT